MEEEDEILQARACKLPRRRGSDGESTNSRFHSSSWHHHNSSRIIRVSRASGGKDRHSKVMTSKGLRDRRVRLSVNTAIQFYDLQDRLGYDQPSKAVEWLIKSASDAISELPSLNNFPDTPQSDDHEKRENTADVAVGVVDGENGNGQNLSLAKSACSSNSETSKGSGLSLSRSDIRVKARERARERTTKEKEKEKEKNDESHRHHHNVVVVPHHNHNVNLVSQTASFTELLTGSDPNKGCDEANNNMMFNKAAGRLQWCSSTTPMDYFLGLSSSRTTTHNHNHLHHHQYSSSSSSGFSLAQIQLGHSLPEAMNHVSAFNNNVSGDNHNHSSSDPHLQQQHLSLIPDHLMSAVVTSSAASSHHHHHHQPSGNDYNLNSTMSSGLAGYNRGTLQSNSPSLLPHSQRFSPIDGSTVPFFIGAASSAAAVAAPAMENNNNNNHHQHQFSSVFDGSRLQLYYGHSDQKGKAKN
ncbi:hypothetical protein AAZX31_08G095500 [Glycine max]|uniref:TCP domain-containing protein n=1 Tax=Glycine max TaxID=3847 RepID=I1KRV6_SOYBN|nr:transcription factor TCP2 [Glycine max]XP_006585088.1 transcription factor TCP2 [Glycine max]XP_006585089.1 transcription factor TCP2 [Glycine max]XP_014634294.1 transcription factor TCP2 [Glycine max]XP_014634295.1 transcription factor TCP2 [Glycine max]XP_014634296.1 transcription factor TCP2 [Glycine max]XP_014634297.1 transcription factor TCP2 [Glycine max]XP_040873991.1 transcription factor TCP2 [Glycine max]XP_040873992.1 transcription factor TCP2 [Glycine max]XP_040873993.1 trans|eukprot:XP_003531162.1 transcription factor TCP2 [Glycine max]